MTGNPLWEWLKAERRHERKQRRGELALSRGPMRTRTGSPCTCIHAPKHHKTTGHCRPGCDCAAGANRA